MSEELIVIETGYKTASANYKIHTIGPLPEVEASERFQDLLSGTAPELPAAKGATVVKVSEQQFLRVHKGFGGSTVLDRVTRGTVV